MAEPGMEPLFASIEDLPRGLTEQELDEVIGLRAARRWADDIKRLLGLNDA